MPAHAEKRQFKLIPQPASRDNLARLQRFKDAPHLTAMRRLANFSRAGAFLGQRNPIKFIESDDSNAKRFCGGKNCLKIALRHVDAHCGLADAMRIDDKH